MKMIAITVLLASLSVASSDDIDSGQQLGESKAASILKALDDGDESIVSSTLSDVSRWIRATEDMRDAGHYEMLCYAAVIGFMTEFKPTDAQLLSFKKWLDKNPDNEHVKVILAAAKKAEKKHASTDNE